MKIRNIIAVGLSLFALASCSKDSQPVNVKDMNDAKLNISMKASARVRKRMEMIMLFPARQI